MLRALISGRRNRARRDPAAPRPLSSLTVNNPAGPGPATTVASSRGTVPTVSGGWAFGQPAAQMARGSEAVPARRGQSWPGELEARTLERHRADGATAPRGGLPPGYDTCRRARLRPGPVRPATSSPSPRRGAFHPSARTSCRDELPLGAAGKGGQPDAFLLSSTVGIVARWRWKGALLTVDDWRAMLRQV